MVQSLMPFFTKDSFTVQADINTQPWNFWVYKLVFSNSFTNMPKLHQRISMWKKKKKVNHKINKRKNRISWVSIRTKTSQAAVTLGWRTTHAKQSKSLILFHFARSVITILFTKSKVSFPHFATIPQPWLLVLRSNLMSVSSAHSVQLILHKQMSPSFLDD